MELYFDPKYLDYTLDYLTSWHAFLAVNLKKDPPIWVNGQAMKAFPFVGNPNDKLTVEKFDKALLSINTYMSVAYRIRRLEWKPIVRENECSILDFSFTEIVKGIDFLNSHKKGN